MNELHFCLKGKLGEIENTMRQIVSLAEVFNCTCQMEPFSSEGKKFKLAGKQQNLLLLQKRLQAQNLPKGQLKLSKGSKNNLCKIQPIKKEVKKSRSNLT